LLSTLFRSFLLIYGLNGILGLILADNKTIEDMEMMNPSQMMGAQNPAQKNYKQMFKVEKDNYEILNYKFGLEDVEEAFLYKYSSS
jgi:hypothetical protein